MWNDRIEHLKERRMQHSLGGGEERIAHQHAAGKLTAAQRISFLLDEGSFIETSPCMMTSTGSASFKKEEAFPGDGVITGWGTIDGRKVCVAAEDFTVIGGTLGVAHARKIAALQDLALEMRIPIIFLNDSGGARIEEGIHALNGYGDIFTRHVRSSGVIPQICAILGPCSGGACYSPALCDFIFVVREVSQMFLTGPAVVESVLYQSSSIEELGGARMHSEKSGVTHALYNDEQSALRGIRKLLSYLPSNNEEKPAPHPYSPLSGEHRISLRELVPDSGRKAYDMHQVIDNLMDLDSPLFELQKHFAPNAIIGFSTLAGHTVGVIANQPIALGGALDCDASDKISRFIRFCDCFGIPLLTLVDVPAFLPGKDQEQRGIIRHGAKILYAYVEASVPKITVILRKAFGGAYIAMNSKSLGADIVYAWPIAQIAVMGADGAVRILFRKELSKARYPEQESSKLQESYEKAFFNPDIAENAGYVDEVILPEETRSRLIAAFDLLSTKKSTPAGTHRAHGNIPL